MDTINIWKGTNKSCVYTKREVDAFAYVSGPLTEIIYFLYGIIPPKIAVTKIECYCIPLNEPHFAIFPLLRTIIYKSKTTIFLFQREIINK